MGKGVTNLVGGAASSSAHSTVEDPFLSLLCTTTSFELVLLFVLSFGFILLRWNRNKRKFQQKNTIVTGFSIPSKIDSQNSSDLLKTITHLQNSDDETNHLTYTGSTGHKEPRLRRSNVADDNGNVVPSFNNVPVLTNLLAEPTSDMDTSKDSLSLQPESQSDSFFTWDSGGNSGDYSFVHTAVELPKYPEDAITDEERQMLLLYMQSGHPEMLLSSGNLNPPPAIITASENMICDPIAVRGFLETIVEETSDDLRSPSECDETSLGWGSWDESDDDRVTVVEMQTSGSAEENPFNDLKLVEMNGSNQDERLRDCKTNLAVNGETSKSTLESSLTILDKIFEDNCVFENLNQSLSRGDKEMYSESLFREISSDNSLISSPIENCDSLCADAATSAAFSKDILSDSNIVDTSFIKDEKPDLQVSSLNSSTMAKADFESLWISVEKLESPLICPDSWDKNNDCDVKTLKTENLSNPFLKVELSNNENQEPSLITLGSEDDLCLVPSSVAIDSTFSGHNYESLCFSDDFKDYFLPTDSFSTVFNRDEIKNDIISVTEEVSVSSKDKKMRCFRIGFDDEFKPASNTEYKEEKCTNSENYSELKVSSSDSEPETMFAPINGDIAYSSSWLRDHKPAQEETASGADACCSTMTTDVRCVVQCDSPPFDNNRRSLSDYELSASDEEIQGMRGSLSRWQHHTDLQHVQEATSPLTRWQHQADLQLFSANDNEVSKNKQSFSDDSDDGLPPQLKELYNSFKTKDKKSRIRIKDDKIHNFKALGLWDCETKVTLPPFQNTSPDKNLILKQIENIPSKEDLDDLELDMFASERPPHQFTAGDSDVDDALKSFNHLNDYSSNSDEQSGNETEVLAEFSLDYPVEKFLIDSNDSAQIKVNNQCDASPTSVTPETEAHSLENPCSDNSDNCPLCKEASFNKSRIDDLFLEKADSDSINNADVQSLLLNTYPKMTRLTEDNSTDPESRESNFSGNSSKDLTSSDSDEGKKGVKDVKKRKKRPKESQCNELKHDDSGYVEDDEDDDDDSLEERKSSKLFSVASKSVNDLDTSLKSEIKTNMKSSVIPRNFEEFSKKLENSVSCDDFKLGLQSEKWKIPENLSQFSAWLLDNELKKISSKDENEKLLTDDIKNLRENTITQFLKNSVVEANSFKEILTAEIKENISMSKLNLAASDNLLKCSDKSEILTNIAQINSIKPNSYVIDETHDNISDFNIKHELDENFIARSSKMNALNINEDDSLNSNLCDKPEINFNDSLLESEISDTNLNADISAIENKNSLMIVQLKANDTDLNQINQKTKLAKSNDCETEKPQTIENVNDKLSALPAQSLETIMKTPEKQYKVNNTTIEQNVNNKGEDKYTATISGEMNDGVMNENKINLHLYDSYVIAKDVAPPMEEIKSLSHTETGSSSDDPMTCGEEKGAREGCNEETDDISSLRATGVKTESEQETHVSSNSNRVSLNNSQCAISETPESQFLPETNYVFTKEKIIEDSSDNKELLFINNDKNLLESEASLLSDENNELKFSGRKANDFSISPEEKQVSEKYSFDLLSRNEVSEPVELCNSLLNADISEDSEINSENFIRGGILFHNIELNNSKPDIITSCEIQTKVAENRKSSEKIEYKRSNSAGRENSESEGILDSSCVQSKSTPDLRKCHEQQLNSSIPLSARLSKSVNQRIQDYLGYSTRGGYLNRSLPPNERSRHYRRICVSTETVVERAARFEARSRSTSASREVKVELDSRSGSCPPSSMRNYDRNNRSFVKPTATVRPTIDYRTKTYLENSLNSAKSTPELMDKENMFELITGYERASKVSHKPPVAPAAPSSQQLLKNARLKGKIASARKDFFEKLSQNKSSYIQKDEHDLNEDSDGLNRFDVFRRSAREERARLAASHPDLGALEAAVRSSKRKIDQLKKKKKSGSQASPAPFDAGPPQQSSMPSTTAKEGTLCLPYRRCTGEIAWASCAKRLEEAKAKSKPNLAHEQLEIVDRSSFWFKRPAETKGVRAHRPGTVDDYEEDPASSNGGGSAITGTIVVENCDFLGTRAKSMDFLLDADNRDKVQPPENRLAAGQGRVKSEHELRIERSLQNLTIPDWYKQSAWSTKPKEGFILRRGSEGSAGESRKRWQGFSTSRTPSATSLTIPQTGSYSHRNIIVPKRVTPTSGEWRYVGSLVSSRESLTPASPASLSPRECASAAFQYGLSSSLSRWSSSRLSTSSAPLTSLSVHRSFRQPYLGWRAAAANSSGYTPSSGGGSRSSPGVSPITATTPLQGSRPNSPRRGSQEHHFVYGLHQNQITSAATLRPDGSEATDISNRISPLALNTTNVFFNSNVEVSHADPYDHHPQRFGSTEMRRDRYSYTQSLYSGTVIMSPGTTDDDRRNFNVDQVPRIIASLDENEATETDQRFTLVKSPQPPPRLWMESSFVGTKQDGSESQKSTTRSIRIVPSDSVRPGSGARSSTSSLRGTCATQTAMDTRELIDHLHNFLRGLQNRNQVLRPSSTSAFTPVPSSSNSGFHEVTTTFDNDHTDDGSHLVSSHLNRDTRPNLVDYETEPRGYPRGSWRHSSSSSKDISPDNSSTDNELWLSVTDDVGHKGFRPAPEHLDGRSSSRSSISPTSPSARYLVEQKRVSEDSTGSGRPIFFASSRRGSKGSNHDPKLDTSPYHQQQVSSGIIDYSNPNSKEQYSRKSSSTHSEESGYIRRDSKSGGSSSWRDSKTDQESSSATTSRGEKDSKSSASMEEVLESLLAIPPVSRSSSPTSPRRSKYYVFAHDSQRSQTQGNRTLKEAQPAQSIQQQLEEKNTEGLSKSKSTSSQANAPQIRDPQWAADDGRGLENIADDLGKMLDERLKFPPNFPSSSTTASQLLPFPSPTDEMNHGSFCHSSSTSPLEDDVQSPTSMEVLVPEGEEPELSSIIEDDTKLEGDGKQKADDLTHELHQPHLTSHDHLFCQREQSQRPPLQRQSTLPSCSSADLLSQQSHDGLYANLFAGLQPGSYTRGIAEGSLRRPQSLCLVLLHLPCMFCARALAPPPQINSFSNGPARMTCVSEPTTPVRDMICPASYEPGSCCGQPVNPVVLDNTYVPYLTNIDSNPGKGPSVTTATEDKGATQEASGGTPSKKKKPARGITDIYSSDSHLKCHRPKCSKSLPTDEARVKFRTCANCYTYYCSRQCRKLHMSRHKDHCPQTRISNLCKQVLMKARDDPVSRRHLSLCAKRGLLSRGRGAVKLLFLNPEDANDYLIHGWESAKGQTLYVSRSDLLPQEMGADVFTQVRNFCDKYNPERKFILLAAITVANEIAAALEREVVVRGAKMHLSPSLPEDDVQTLILTITKTDPETGDPAQTTVEDRKNGLSVVVEQLAARGVDLEKLYPHTYRKILRFVNDNEPFTPISIFPTDQRNGRVFMCIILPWADADIITNISTKGGLSKSSKRKWPL